MNEMRADANTYQKVAEHCSSFKAKSCNNCGCTNTTSEGAGITCTNCEHFATDGSYCKLDLYDEILNRHNF